MDLENVCQLIKLCALNDKMQVGGIFYVLALVFDRVIHDILLSKLNSYVIQGEVGQCFKSYVNGRKQKSGN
jgi:hypothetical protein